MPIFSVLFNEQAPVPRLPPEVAAQFAPGANVMILNATRAEFRSMPERPVLASNYVHEGYHLLQTVCTGYAFARAQRIKEVTLRSIRRSLWRDLRRNPGASALIFACNAAPEFLRRRFEIDRIKNVAAVLIQWNTLHAIQMQAPANDHSLAGADVPDLFQDLALIQQELGEAGASGLSAWHIIEGGAAVFQLAYEATQTGADDLDATLTAGLPRFEADYGVAYAFARERCGARAAALFLPAAALALRYERPGEAFPGILEQLRTCEPGTEIAHARSLAGRRPRMAAAGRYLGTAAELSAWSWRRPWRRPHSYYKAPLAFLSRPDRPVDEIDLLGSPAHFFKLPHEFFQGLVLVTHDGLLAASTDSLELHMRAQLAGIQLRFDKRPRWEKQVLGDLSAWGRSVAQRMFAGP